MSTSSAPPPNIILIVTDQQRYDTIRALGFPHVDTPAMDRLVREGSSFSNCFITAPSCVPSRASLFTGLYPHNSGIFKNADRWSHTWVEQLRGAGYHCVNIGKMHTYPYDVPAGFHERYVVENKDRYLEERWYFDEWDKALAARGLVKQQRELYRQWPGYRESLGAFDWKLPHDAHPDVFVGRMACWWLETKPSPKPLFLQIGFPGPHPPYDPPREYAERYLRRDLPLAEVTADELAAQPWAFRHLREHNFAVDHDSVVHLPEPTREQRQRQRAYYLGNVTLIDEEIGRIMATLERRGYLDNAVVIFTSDHGDCLTDHGHSQKWTMYDTIVRVPTVVWAPGRAEAGRQVDGLVQWMDLGPTILELAGVKPPGWMDARSVAAALRGPDEFAGRDYVIAEHGRDGILDGTELMVMIRDRRWKLVMFVDHADGQLFDLAADPAEVRNRWDDPAPEARDAKARLRETLLGEVLRSGYRSRTWREPMR